MKFSTEQRLNRSRQLQLLVDECDAWLLSEYTWSVVDGYAATTSFRRNLTLYIQHFIVGLPIDPDIVVDHIDQNKMNNQRSNLRYATRQENMLNWHGKDNPMLGIRQLRNGYWHVRLLRSGEYLYSPQTYPTIEQAQRARDMMLNADNEPTSEHMQHRSDDNDRT